MGLLTYTYQLTAGQPENVNQLSQNLTDIQTVLNGNVNSDNLAANAVTTTELTNSCVTDAKLASPNNSVYKTLFSTGSMLGGDVAAATYILSSQTSGSVPAIASGGGIGGAGPIPSLFYFDDADFTVGSLTQKLRLRAQVACNATQAAITFTFGLYPVTFAGGVDALTMTLGTVVASSTVAIASPSASTVTSGVNSDFTVPSDGAYALGVATSGQITNNSMVLMTAQLQTRNV